MAFRFHEIATSRVALLAMTRRYGSTLGLNNANPYKPPHTLQKFVIPRERSDRGNLPEGETVVSATDYNIDKCSCMIVSFSIAGRRASAGEAVSPCWQVFGLVVFGSEPLRASQ